MLAYLILFFFQENRSQARDRNELGDTPESSDEFSQLTCCERPSADPAFPGESPETSGDSLPSDDGPDARLPIGPGRVFHDEPGRAGQERGPVPEGGAYWARSNVNPCLIVVEMAPGDAADGYSARERFD